MLTLPRPAALAIEFHAMGNLPMAALIDPSFVQELRSGTVRRASEHIQRQCDNWQLAGAIV